MPIFGKGGVSEDDCFVLRMGQNPDLKPVNISSEKTPHHHHLIKAVIINIPSTFQDCVLNKRPLKVKVKDW